jgi:hypothetical protein
MSRPLRSTRVTGLHRYYEPVRQRRAATVLSASRFLPLDALPLTATRLGGGSVGARLPTFHAEAADRAHAASMPGTAWPVNGTSARLISGPTLRPGFDATWINNDTSSAVRSRSSSRSPPDPLTAGLSPDAHHNSLQLMQLGAV